MVLGKYPESIKSNIAGFEGTRKALSRLVNILEFFFLERFQRGQYCRTFFCDFYQKFLQEFSLRFLRQYRNGCLQVNLQVILQELLLEFFQNFLQGLPKKFIPVFLHACRFFEIYGFSYGTILWNFSINLFGNTFGKF